MRRARNERDHIWHNGDAQTVAVREDHRHRLLVFKRYVHVVGIRQSYLGFATRHHVEHDRVRGHDVHVVRFQLAKELVSSLIAQLGIERRRME